MGTSLVIRAAWKDVSVACTEHETAAEETAASAGRNSLSVALLPIKRAVWRVDNGSSRTGSIEPGTTSVRSSREVIWARWDRPCKCIHVSLQPSLMARVAAQAGVTWREPEYREGVYDATALHCALLLAEEAANGGLSGDLYVESIANLLAVHTLRTYAGVAFRSHDEEPARLDALKLKAVKDYIEANLSGPLSLNAMAKIAATSPFHFARLFKAATGFSPHRFVVQRRIERAKILLVTTPMLISDIAAWVGMTNQSHFTAYFRKLIGCTPKRFRDQAR